MVAHTKGPWNVGAPSDVCVEVRAGGYLIARVFTDPGTPTSDNARLIAAAPDMLVALKLALRGLEFDLHGDGKRDLAAVLTKTIALAEVES